MTPTQVRSRTKSHEVYAVYLVPLPSGFATRCSFIPSFPGLHVVVVGVSSLCIAGQDFHTLAIPEIGLSKLYLTTCSDGRSAKLLFFLMSFLTFSCCNLSSLFLFLSAADMESRFFPSCQWLFMCLKIIPAALPPHLLRRQNNPGLLANSSLVVFPPPWGVVTAVTWLLIPISFCARCRCFIRDEQSALSLLHVLLGCVDRKSQIFVSGKKIFNPFLACMRKHHVERGWLRDSALGKTSQDTFTPLLLLVYLLMFGL